MDPQFDLFDLMRTVNAVGSVILLAFFVFRVARRWDQPQMTVSLKFTAQGHALFLLTLAYGSTESIFQGVEPGARIVLSSIALAFSALGIYFGSRLQAWLLTKPRLRRWHDRLFHPQPTKIKKPRQDDDRPQ